MRLGHTFSIGTGGFDPSFLGLQHLPSDVLEIQQLRDLAVNEIMVASRYPVQSESKCLRKP